MTDTEQDPRVIAARIVAAATAASKFASAYRDTDPLDTSPDERRRLADADALLDAALERFV